MSTKGGPVSPEDVVFEDRSNHVQIKELERKVKRTTRVAICLGVLFLLVLGVLVGLFINESIDDDDDDDDNSPTSGPEPFYCGTRPEAFKAPEDLLGEPADPGVFHSLTVSEILRVREYFEATINLPHPMDNSTMRDARVHTMDLALPRKSDVLNYLDNGGPKPDRVARVVIFRGDLVPPVVEEYLCGPLNNISCEIDKTLPFSHRPMEFREYDYMGHHVINEIQRLFGDILRESFDGSFDFDECEDDCLNYWFVPVGSNIYGETPYKRSAWLWPLYDLPYYSMFPLDIGFLLDLDGVDEYKFSILKVWYAGQLYDDLDEFRTNYSQNSIPKTKIARPVGENTTFATLLSRMSDEEKSQRHQRPPQLIEPDGKRYTVRHGKIEYLGIWSFHYRMSTIYGPAIFDVRFKDERIAYEISLMDLVVQYSGMAPMARQCQWVDSAFGLGTSSKGVFPGADCPSTATLLPFVTNAQDNREPAVFPQGMCVFEHNLGHPLRRHHSYSSDSGAFFGGMMDSALVARSIHPVDNYDYIIDFTFHQNGALGVSLRNTGYIMTSFFSADELAYGSEISKHMFGPVHLHWAHFKVDLDINNGTSNRYETLDIEEETKDILQSGGRELSTVKIVKHLKRTENEANYKYDFDKPRYNIFYNEQARNQYGVHRAYRLHAKGLSSQLLKPDLGNELAMTWGRYQISVTKHKDEEMASSSPYNQWNTSAPIVDFSSFYADNENITDEDLVAWVTLGNPHIVHTEDIPVTPTPGTELSFHLLPHNYFPECPSMKSPDSMYVGLVDKYEPEDGLVFEMPGSSFKDPQSFASCQLKPENYSAVYENDMNSIIEYTESKGVL